MAKTTWIDEQEAGKLVGLTPRILVRYVNEKKLPIRMARATPRAAPRFVKEDIETHLSQSIIATSNYYGNQALCESI